MFCACMSIIFCVCILICGATVSIIDITRYDFGLYYALMATVGLTAAIAVCVVRPKHGCCTKDPRCYTKCCNRLNRCLIAEQQRAAMSKSGLRDGNTFSNVGGDADKRSGASNAARQQRATLVMLRPAMELMQHMLSGLVTRDEEHQPKEDEDTSDATDDTGEDSRHRRNKSKRKKKKKKLLLPGDEACLYTILETSAADVTVVQHTEATSIVTVHESYPQLLNDSAPNSPAALLSPVTLAAPRQQFLMAQRKHLLNQISSDSPRSRALDSQSAFTFQRHDILSETLDEERISETRCSSTHEG